MTTPEENWSTFSKNKRKSILSSAMVGVRANTMGLPREHRIAILRAALEEAEETGQQVNVHPGRGVQGLLLDAQRVVERAEDEGRIR